MVAEPVVVLGVVIPAFFVPSPLRPLICDLFGSRLVLKEPDELQVVRACLFGQSSVEPDPNGLGRGTGSRDPAT
jgi:hypothetical protein